VNMPTDLGFRRPTQLITAIVAVVCVAGLGVVAAKQVQPKTLAANNLFALVGQLKVTTASMVGDTESLQAQVNHVQTQLQQLDAQAQILRAQAQTGQALATQLQRQVSLTTEGVDFMKQILMREHQTATITAQVATLTSSLTAGIDANTRQAENLTGALERVAATSNVLSGQMDGLLAQLTRSEQDFRFFGQINHLLPTLTQPLLGNGTGSGSGTVLPSNGTSSTSGSSGSPSGSLPIIGGLLP